MMVRAVQSHVDREAFIRLPMKLYAHSHQYVPHLLMERRDFIDPKKNPFFDHADVQLFLAEEKGTVVGRVAAIINHAHNEFHDEKTGFFGMLDTVNDRQLVAELLDTCARWLSERGMERMRGPANFSTNDECGLLVDGFEGPPVFMMTWNPSYLAEHVASTELEPVMDLYAWHISKEDLPLEPLIKKAEAIRRRTPVTVRKARLKKLEQEVELAFGIYNRAWEKNWGFVPMTQAEFMHAAKDLKWVLDEDLLYFAELDGDAVGFSLALPDFNQVLKRVNGKLFPFGWWKLLRGKKQIDTIRVITMGVLPEYRSRGIDVLLYFKTIEEGIAKGYRHAELSWVLENNDVMNHIAARLGARRYRTYRFYERPV